MLDEYSHYLEECDQDKNVDQFPKQVMITLPGEKTSFRCECGCNVFTKKFELQYECNACGAWYIGEDHEGNTPDTTRRDIEEIVAQLGTTGIMLEGVLSDGNLTEVEQKYILDAMNTVNEFANHLDWHIAKE